MWGKQKEIKTKQKPPTCHRPFATTCHSSGKRQKRKLFAKIRAGDKICRSPTRVIHSCCPPSHLRTMEQSALFFKKSKSLMSSLGTGQNSSGDKTNRATSCVDDIKPVQFQLAKLRPLFQAWSWLQNWWISLSLVSQVKK